MTDLLVTYSLIFRRVSPLFFLSYPEPLAETPLQVGMQAGTGGPGGKHFPDPSAKEFPSPA